VPFLVVHLHLVVDEVGGKEKEIGVVERQALVGRPLAELSTATTALLRSTLLFHPRMAPPSVSKRKMESPFVPLSETGKPLPLTNTVPVGPSDGMLTTSGCIAPLLGSYNVERFVPLSEIHSGFPGA
jgi:hypothetical protein